MIKEIHVTTDLNRPTLKALQESAWNIAESKGFHEGYSSAGRRDTLVRLCLIQTEVSEAAQEVKRHWTEDGYPTLTHGEKFAEEMADTVIRILDLCESVGVDLENAVINKMIANKKRPYLYGTPHEVK